MDEVTTAADMGTVIHHLDDGDETVPQRDSTLYIRDTSAVLRSPPGTNDPLPFLTSSSSGDYAEAQRRSRRVGHRPYTPAEAVPKTIGLETDKQKGTRRARRPRSQDQREVRSAASSS